MTNKVNDELLANNPTNYTKIQLPAATSKYGPNATITKQIGKSQAEHFYREAKP